MTKNYFAELRAVSDFQFGNNNITPGFPEHIARLRHQDLDIESCSCREDFRSDNVFTIDCESCKDMDDAIGIKREDWGYRLSVHIADVASYIPFGSELDQLAISRATSIYLPHLTVPMLPEVLSNDLCSLNPGEDRNTLSVIMQLDHHGNVISSRVTKGLIRSRVKGVYSEINRILDGEKNAALLGKYSLVYRDLLDMETLFNHLRITRICNGANVSDDNRPKITVCEDCILVTPVKEGIAENMIEEFMILANRIVAQYLIDHDLPGIYRYQQTKNNRAAYGVVKTHHVSLALESYSHFTSPIRRVADLKIHQILSMYLNGHSPSYIHEVFDDSLEEVCERATKRSRAAKEIERSCIRYCYVVFFKEHWNYSFTGQVNRCDENGYLTIKINHLNINVVAESQIGVKAGMNLSFRVKVSKQSRFFAKNLRVLTA